MSKLNKEDLWDECCLAFNAALARANQQYPYRWERINQAKEQTKEMIQKPGRDKKLDNQYTKLLEEAKRLGVGEKEFIDKILKEYKKPEVTEEWIWKAIDYIKEYPTYHRLEEKLKEAGVEIIKK